MYGPGSQRMLSDAGTLTRSWAAALSCRLGTVDGYRIPPRPGTRLRPHVWGNKFSANKCGHEVAFPPQLASLIGATLVGTAMPDDPPPAYGFPGCQIRTRRAGKRACAPSQVQNQSRGRGSKAAGPADGCEQAAVRQVGHCCAAHMLERWFDVGRILNAVRSYLSVVGGTCALASTIVP